MASRVEISGLSVDGVCEYLERTEDKDTAEQQTIEVFREKRVNGQSYLDPTEDGSDYYL